MGREALDARHKRSGANNTGEDHVLVAGSETGTYTVAGSSPVKLLIRTSRYLRYDADRGRWLQFHHHGSIAALAAYQEAILRRPTPVAWPLS